MPVEASSARWSVGSARGGPWPTSVTVYSGPSRNASTRAGWAYVATMRATSRTRASRLSTRELGPIPFAVPSHRGLTKSGNGAGRSARAASSGEARLTCGGTGTPAAATTRCAQSLSSVVDSVRASDPRVGTPAISQSTGTHASRFRGP